MKKSVEGVIVNELDEQVNMKVHLLMDGAIMYEVRRGEDRYQSGLFSIKEALELHKLLGLLPLPKLR